MREFPPPRKTTPPRPHWLAGAGGFEPRHRCGHAGQRKGVAHMLTQSSQACCDGTTKVPDLMENSVPARPVYVQRGKTHIGTCDEDRCGKGDLIIRIVLQPSEELRNAIDLIIVTTVWK